MSSPKLHFTFAILSWGGIGDTLRNLSLIPHEAIFDQFGWRMPVVHQPWQEMGCREDALPPGPAAIQDLVERCPSLRWGGIGALGTFPRIGVRLLREVLTVCNEGVPPLYAFKIQLTPEEAGALPVLDSSRVQVAIQTHLLGMPSKKWSVANWRTFLGHLRARLPNADFHIVEPSPAAAELRLDAHFYSYPDFNLAQWIALVRKMDYVLSIDSWVKCVAALDRIPQAIIIPDRRADYPDLTAESFLRYEFATLKSRPEVTLIGLDLEKKIHTLPVMSQVRPEGLFALLESCLPEDKRRPH